MPDIASGLGTPQDGENVNTDAGFEAALARKTGNEEALAEREPRISTSILDGLTEGPEGPARDDAGRFAADEVDEAELEDTPEEPEEEEETSEEEPAAEAEPDDPWQIRYEEAQKVIGRQGNELGQERQARQALEQRLAALEGRLSAQPAAPMLTGDALIERADELIVERGEVQAAIHALNEDPSERLYKQVLRSWVAEDPVEAMRFDTDLRALQREQQAGQAQPAAPTVDPWVEEQKSHAAMTRALATVQSESQDWDTVAPHLEKALEQVPQRVAAMVASSDEAERLDGVRLVADRARLIAATSLGSKAKDQQKAAATERKKAAAGVTSGSLRPVSPADTTGNDDREAAIKAFKKEFIETPSTSVQDGLTGI
jgi:hypothetical protein